MLAASTVTRRDAVRVAGPASRPTLPPPPVPAIVASTTQFLGDLHEFLTGAPEPQPAPTPADATATPYGDIGKWMLGRNGQLADWPSHPFKTLYQPINVIIVDSTSTTAAESAAKVNAALTAAGFPAQPIHSTGYQGLIDGAVYGQQPTGPQQAFSNAHWLLPNDHGRVFGPAPAPDGAGYVWTASFSREAAGLYCLTPTHVYVSFDRARARVRAGLLATGATDLGVVDLHNTLSGPTLTTGDHDGYAVVISLR